MNETELWRELGQQLRVDSVRCSAVTKTGHPTSSMSAADLMAVLLAKYLRLDIDSPYDPRNDHLVFSKGHASPLLYSMFKAAGAIGDEELLTFRKLGSRLQGHPTPAAPWVDVATGSLGQGLPYGVGIALAGKKLDRLPYRVWVLHGDSEVAEGSVWEAFEHAAFYGLDNLTVVLDVNRLGQRGETMHGWDLDSYVERARAFGWHPIAIDGHDVEAIDRAYAEAVSTTGAPTVVVAKTIKGKGVEEVEDKDGWHGKALDNPEQAIEELGGVRNIVVEVAKPEGDGQPHRFETEGGELPTWDEGEEVATRRAYGDALVALGASRGDVVALDGEVSNSTYAEEFAKAYPERYFEMFIAEQQMVAAAVGLQVRGWVPFASTFAAFFTRAYDFVRMAAISDANLTARLVAEMAERDGIQFLRTLRGKTTVRTSPAEDVRIGGSRVAHDGDNVAIVACGITVGEAVEAAEALAGEGIAARVLDCYSVKPIDAEALRAAARECGALVTVEDHWPEGGLGDAVLDALAAAPERPPVVKLAVREMPSSGAPDELLAAAGIDA